MASTAIRRAATAFFIIITVAGCGGGSSSAPTAPTPVATPASPTITSLVVTGAGCANDVCAGTVGGSLQLTATARLSDSSTQTVTLQAQWTSSNTSVATVAPSGLVTYRASGDADVIATYQGKLSGQTVRIVPAGPRTSFGAGTYLVGREIVAGRYFTDPASGCYWERLRGLGGSLGDIIANDFIGYNAGQTIVDIAGGDLAFKSDSDCGTWFNTPRRGLASNISPGIWLVGAQISPGTYSVNAGGGCYWARLRDFSGVTSGIISNNFMSGAGRVLVAIQPGDVGFEADGDCGNEWTRMQAPTSASLSAYEYQAPGDIEANWQARRRRFGPVFP